MLFTVEKELSSDAVKLFTPLNLAIFNDLTNAYAFRCISESYSESEFETKFITLQDAFIEWIGSIAAYKQVAIEEWFKDLSALQDSGKLSLDQPRNLASFSVGKVSQSYKGSKNSGMINWFELLPNSNLALFNAIPIDWRTVIRVIPWR